MSYSLDPDQDRHSVGPDLGPNCLQRLSADNKSLLARKKINEILDYKTNDILSIHPWRLLPP